MQAKSGLPGPRTLPLRDVPKHRTWATERWLRRAVFERRFPFFKVDGKVLIDLDVLDEYVASKRIDAHDDT